MLGDKTNQLLLMMVLHDSLDLEHLLYSVEINTHTPMVFGDNGIPDHITKPIKYNKEMS
jgi:hypothetical protein